jgi:hypothetical protein
LKREGNKQNRDQEQKNKKRIPHMTTSIQIRIALVTIVLLLRTTPTQADIAFADFSSLNNLTLNGNAMQAGAALRVSPAQPDKKGSVWYNAKQRVESGFTTIFQFRFSDLGNGGADGLAFVIQNHSVTALGTGAGYLGYAGISNSLAVEFDTWLNPWPFNDPSDNHISVHTLGANPNSANEAASIGSTIAIPTLNNGAVHTAAITYDGAGILKVFIDNMDTPVLSVNVNLASTLMLDDGKAFVGFTSATGWAYQNHDVLSWDFTDSYDVTPPVTAVTVPANEAIYRLGQVVTADYSCEDEAGGSGLASCDGTAPPGSVIDTATVGTKTFIVSSTDLAGNAASVTNIYYVVYDFTGAGGFLPPINNPPTVNTAKAGSTIPVKWKLPDGSGGFFCDLDVVIGVHVQQVSCGAFAYSPTDPVEELSTAGSSGLRCENGQFIYNWKTASTQRGKCYVLILGLADGTLHEAWFSLK